MTNDDAKNKLINSGKEAELERKYSYDFETKFEFLKLHYGFRRGAVHVLMGISGGGKTTMVRSILMDLIERNPNTKIGIWLSEESVNSYELELFEATRDMAKFKNIVMCSEKGLKTHELSTKYNEFISGEMDFFIFDNITTSRFYMQRKVDIQADFSNSIKAYADIKNIPVLVVAHTNAQISQSTDRVINQNDIRGGKDLSNMAEFFYTLQSFYVEKTMYLFVIVEKYRGYKPEDKWFILSYDKKRSINHKDSAVDFSEFKNFFKSRNRL